MALKDFITGIKVTIPIEAIATAIAARGKAAGEVKIRKGAQYALAGELWIVQDVDPKGIRLMPRELTTMVVEEKRR
jgi:hypothetical protein